MGKSFCGVPSKRTQDWAVNNHMLQTGLSFAENFCNKTPKQFSKICQIRSSEVKETINFKNFRGAAPNPAGGLTAPPRPLAGFLVGIHIKIIPVTPLQGFEIVAMVTRKWRLSSYRAYLDRRGEKERGGWSCVMKRVSRERIGRNAVHQKMTKYLSKSSNVVEQMATQFSSEVLGKTCVIVHCAKFIQCIQNFFPKLCLILKNRFLVRLSSNFQERLFMPLSSPEFLLWWGYY